MRVPWHLGADGAVFANAASKAQSQKLTAWIKAKVGNDPTKVRAGYKLDGTATVSYLDPEFVATLGPAAMNDPSEPSLAGCNLELHGRISSGIRHRHVLRIGSDPAEHDRDEWELLEPSIFRDNVAHADRTADDRHPTPRPPPPTATAPTPTPTPAPAPLGSASRFATTRSGATAGAGLCW